MGNIIFGMLATPKTHEKFIKNINNFKYDIEGSKFKGKQAPFISELKFYDIRVPKELEDDVVRDLRLWSFHAGTAHGIKMRMFMFVYRMIIRIFTPFKPIREVKGKVKFQLDPYSWKYILPIGILKRQKMQVQMGKDREVM